MLSESSNKNNRPLFKTSLVTSSNTQDVLRVSTFHTGSFVCICQFSNTSNKKRKVKWPRYRPGCGPEGGRGIALLFQALGSRRGGVVSSTPRPHFISGKTRYQLYRRLGGFQGRSGGAENLAPTRIRSPDRPARSQSLYRLSYPTQKYI